MLAILSNELNIEFVDYLRSKGIKKLCIYGELSDFRILRALQGVDLVFVNSNEDKVHNTLIPVDTLNLVTSTQRVPEFKNNFLIKLKPTIQENAVVFAKYPEELQKFDVFDKVPIGILNLICNKVPTTFKNSKNAPTVQISTSQETKEFEIDSLDYKNYQNRYLRGTLIEEYTKVVFKGTVKNLTFFAKPYTNYLYLTQPIKSKDALQDLQEFLDCSNVSAVFSTFEKPKQINYDEWRSTNV